MRARGLHWVGIWSMCNLAIKSNNRTRGLNMRVRLLEFINLTLDSRLSSQVSEVYVGFAAVDDRIGLLARSLCCRPVRHGDLRMKWTYWSVGIINNGQQRPLLNIMTNTSNESFCLVSRLLHNRKRPSFQRIVTTVYTIYTCKRYCSANCTIRP